jgi:hypothetical protein
MTVALDAATQISGFWKLKLAQCASISGSSRDRFCFVAWTLRRDRRAT